MTEQSEAPEQSEQSGQSQQSEQSEHQTPPEPTEGTAAARRRILLVITVYNGEAFVERCLRSSLTIDRSRADVDVLVLDDASPAPGWSQRLEAICADLGVEYYCTPRNLGIPRNVSLGLLTAVERGYDDVIISNSDVIYSTNVVTQLVRASEDERIGSVTAWSNNVSIYSLPNFEPDRFLADPEVVSWVSAVLDGEFGGSAMDIPAGISFCILIPTAVVKHVGVMDPVFGRGYCEETDWSLRSLEAGYRITLAPGAFVYHSGRGSNLDAGLLSGGHTSVPENEAIIDLRYPLFRSQVDAFASSGILQKAQEHALERLVREAGVTFGYSIEVGWLKRVTNDNSKVRCLVAPDGLDGKVIMDFIGFRHEIPAADAADIPAVIRSFFGGREPEQVNLLDRGQVAQALRSAFDGVAPVTQRGNYPARV